MAVRQNLRAKHGADLAEGFQMLETALQLDPGYSDAMAYMNLLYRIEAGIADNDAQSAEFTAKADGWVGKALEARRGAPRSMGPASVSLDVNGPVPMMMMAPPPPPPPPPPPNGAGAAARANPAEVVGGGIRISGEAQQAKLVRQVRPVYPPAAKEAGISGVVRLTVVIGKDGKVGSNIRVEKSAGAALDEAALEAVKQWVYQPTLLNGQPVDVITTVEVNFTLAK
jgi:TonB family protein